MTGTPLPQALGGAASADANIIASATDQASTHANAESQSLPPIPPGALSDSDSVRVDTWLWAIRRVKSRSQATAAARAGHVKVNGDTAKAAQKIHVGDEVRLRVDGFDEVFTVKRLLVKRVGAPQARTAYEDIGAPRPRMVIPVAQRERGTGRPTKKERREIDRLRGRTSR